MRTFVLASACVLALAAAGIAVGKSFDGGTKSTKAVAGTFSATTASKVETRTCTTTDNKTLVSTSGTYTGTATGDPDLTGNISLQTRSLINSTDNVGSVSGKLKIDVASGADTVAQLSGVYSGGQVAGLATGHGQNEHAKLLANFSSGFSPTGGYTGGKIGGGTSGGAAVELGPGQCAPSKAAKEESEAIGSITAVSATSITVAGLTCVVPLSLQSLVSPLTVGMRVEIDCKVSAGATTLTKVEKKK
jgi:hypothetical protein